MDLIFTGVGSRYGAPIAAQKTATKITQWLCERGFLVRTGDAIGMDQVFREAGQGNCRYYAPHGRHNPIPGAVMISPDDEYYRQARDLTANTHPTFNVLGKFEKELHIRNAFEVLGDDLQNPAKFVLCWTPDGAETKTSRSTGGTGQAIRLAIKYNIPVFNINAEAFEARFRAFINHLGRQQC